ncbi:alpha/beta hydrolase [Testudinibacter aquarius]|uniref:Acetyl esterase/lipase n=1 Tax=Testudinibacter aquarius TaxID=1524974 RepID=A0A4R3YBB9_9PAST|nr:alpha/beta hydrolase [Testudinibacter aquarius]KAE9528964.1 hypothetical protein A1D24_08815 [Testudinibacter aquarius]TCV89240.1 acetyl esterase/lipase [Testudinibacter aquarius]TNG93302.1 alpha/beta hydrolase [Testudinibacter aquarius]
MTAKLKWLALGMLVFVVSFVGSAAVKLLHNPLASQYRIDWNEQIGTVHADIAYGSGGQHKFDLYLPAVKKDTYGLVVYLHAGGFTSGDKVDDRQMLQWLASQGYVAAGVNYTLRNEANPTASVDSMSQEIKSAIPVIKQYAQTQGYTLDRMAVAGGSAGGTLALIYAYRDADTSPIPVKMVFEMVGPASFYPEDWGIYGVDNNPQAAAGLFSVMSGKTITPAMLGTPAFDDAVKNISSAMWVNADSVPALIAHGRHDKIAPFASVRHLTDALSRHGIAHDFIEFPHSGHGLQNDDKQYQQYMQKVIQYLTTYLSSP